MNDFAFTPGPWEAAKPGRVWKIANDRWYLAAMYQVPADDQQRANAELMAAAPRLLEIAVEFRNSLELGGDEDPLIAEIDALCAKLRGAK